MKVKAILAHIRRLLAKDKVQDALDLLLALMKDKQRLDDIIHQSGRYTRLISDARLGILSRDEFTKELNTIRENILALLREIEENNSNDILNESLSKSFLSENSKYFPSIFNFSPTRIAVLTGALLSAVGITVYKTHQNKNNPTINVGDNNSGQINQVVIGDSAKNINLQINESQEQKSQAAYKAIRDELIQNILTLSVRIKALGSNPPNSFDLTDKRRVNETELAYQDRAKLFHTEYKNETQRIINKFGYKTETYNAHKVNLAFDAGTSQRITKTYYHFDELQDYSNSLIEQFNHILSLNLSDTEITSRNTSVFNEKICDIKIQLCQAASNYLFEEEDALYRQIVKDHLQLAGIILKKESGQDLYGELLKLSANYQQQKAQILTQRIEEIKPEARREINRRINDPYLIFLRKLAGLPNELTESELWSLSQKKPDETINDLETLMSKASFSYIESDGSSSVYYLNKALQIKDLNTIQKKYIERSIERLNKPELYAGSIGFFIFDVESASAQLDKYFKKADIVFKVNNTLLEDASDISNILGKTSKDSTVVFDVMSGSTIKKITVKGGKALGIKLSPLIMVNFTTQ